MHGRAPLHGEALLLQLVRRVLAQHAPLPQGPLDLVALGALPLRGGAHDLDDLELEVRVLDARLVGRVGDLEPLLFLLTELQVAERQPHVPDDIVARCLVLVHHRHGQEARLLHQVPSEGLVVVWLRSRHDSCLEDLVELRRVHVHHAVRVADLEDVHLWQALGPHHGDPQLANNITAAHGPVVPVVVGLLLDLLEPLPAELLGRDGLEQRRHPLLLLDRLRLRRVHAQLALEVLKASQLPHLLILLLCLGAHVLAVALHQVLHPRVRAQVEHVLVQRLLVHVVARGNDVAELLGHSGPCEPCHVLCSDLDAPVH
mmetsp:Transcript_35403/g.87030  ORF Transcript_35403/g.87030 Transcript_35403/m.87030 type:complete len:315 (+) Transcript_35403:511-1455(+)